MEHLQLSTAAAEWLVLDSGLAIAPTSPFAFLRKSSSRSTADQRAAAARPELVGSEALRLLASPEQRVRIVVQAPGKAAVRMTFFTRDGKACAFFFDPRDVHVGPRRELGATVQALLRHLRAPQELEGQQILFWPGVLGLLAVLWPGGSGEPMTRPEALKLLGSPGPGDGQADAVVDELLAARLVEDHGGRLALAPKVGPWLERALGGHFVEIDVLPLNGAQVPSPAEPRTRLLFVGPPGGRLLSRRLEGEALAGVLKGAAPTEPRGIQLLALPPDRLAGWLGRQLGVSGSHLDPGSAAEVSRG